MPLRPLAPLAVIGAGLLMMSIATRSASADDGGAPGAVDAASSDGALVVTWSPPAETDGLREYDLLVTDPATGHQVTGRVLEPDVTRSVIGLDELGGLSELSVSVTSSYTDGAHAPGRSVRVLLPQGPAKPEVAPVVRAEGRALQVVLPDAPEGVTGRVVRLYRDGVLRASVSVAAGKAVVTRQVAAGHRYRVAYQDVSAAAAGAFSELSGEVKVTATRGPAAVRRIRASSVDGGLRVRWSPGAGDAAEVAGYRVTVSQPGVRVGVVVEGGARSAVVPGIEADGVRTVTVVATGVDGGVSSSTAVLSAR